MNRALRYVGYMALSLLFGFLSSRGKNDLLYSISGGLFPILITIIVLYVTLSNLVYNQIVSVKRRFDVEITAGIDALKRNIRWMFILLGIDFLLFIVIDILPEDFFGICSDGMTLFDRRIAVDALTFFSLFYYLYVIYDSAMAFFNLMKAKADRED